MKVFLTGASGGLGSALIPQLVAAGHSVLALSRSTKSDEKIKAAGPAEIIRGAVADLDVLKSAASRADAVIHAAFNHDVFNEPNGYLHACNEDRAAIQVMGDALLASGGKTIIYTAGTLSNLGPDEGSGSAKLDHLPRYKSEDLILAFGESGLRGLVVKLPPVVHCKAVEHPFISIQIAAAKKLGYAGYIEGSKAVWCSAHYIDVASLLVLCLTKGGSGIYHAVDEEGIPLKDITDVISKKLGVEMKSISAETAQANYGLIGMFMTLGQRTTATRTKSVTGWQPKEYGLIKEMDNYSY